MTVVLLNPDMFAFAKSVDLDQLAYEEANWSGSAPFVIQDMNLYQQPGLSNLIGWWLEVGVAWISMLGNWLMIRSGRGLD